MSLSLQALQISMEELNRHYWQAIRETSSTSSGMMRAGSVDEVAPLLEGVKDARRRFCSSEQEDPLPLSVALNKVIEPQHASLASKIL